MLQRKRNDLNNEFRARQKCGQKKKKRTWIDSEIDRFEATKNVSAKTTTPMRNAITLPMIYDE